MARAYRTSLIIEGDSKGGIRAVKATEAELAKLDSANARSRSRQVRNTATIARSYRDLTSTIAGTRSAIAALGVGAAVGGLVRLTSRQAEAAREADNLAKTVGTTAAEIQTLQYVTEQAGLGADKAGDIIKDLGDKIGDAALTGGGELAEVLDRINLSANDLQRLAPTQQLLQISKAIEGLPQAQQVNVLESVADDASRLLPLLRDGGRLLRQYSQEAQDFHIALGDDDVDRLLEANRATQRFSGAMRGLGNDIAIAVAPALADSVDDMSYLRDIVTDEGFKSSIATLASAFATTAGFLAEGTREFVSLGESIGTGAARLAGYSNELDDINSKLERLQSMRQSSVLSRAGLFNFGDGLDTYIDDADIDRYVKKLQARRSEIQKSLGMAGGKPPVAAGPAGDPVNVPTDPAAGLVNQYDKRHEKLQELLAARKRLESAIADNPGRADYRRSLAEVNRQIDSLNRSSRSTVATMSEQEKAQKRLSQQYDHAVSDLRQQIALHGDSSDAARLRYRLEQGDLSDLGDVRRQNLISMQAELDALDRQTAALERQQQAVSSLFPEFQRLKEAHDLRASVSDLPQDMQAFGRRRADQMARDTATQGLPGMSGLDPQYNGAFGEANRLSGERDEFEQAYQQRREAFQQYARQHQEDKAEADAAIEALDKEHNRRMLEYEDQIGRARIAGGEQTFASLADLSRSFDGENNAIYRGLFATSRAFSIAKSSLAVFDAISSAMRLPFPANMAAAGTAAVQASSMLSGVSSVSMGGPVGQAHDGIDSIPASGTWILDKGERVVDARMNRDLTRYLERQTTNNTTNQGDRSVTIHNEISVQVQPGQTPEEARRQGNEAGKQLYRAMDRWAQDAKRPGGALSEFRK